MSITTADEERSLAHNANHNEREIIALIEDNMDAIKALEIIMLEIADRTHNGDLEDACVRFIDDVAPVFREYVR